MKENINIEKLFKEKFDSFEGEVSPDLWANIQQGINVPGTGTGAAGAGKTGLSSLAKTAIITGGLITAGIATYYFYPEKSTTNLVVDNTIETVPNKVDEQIADDIYQLEDEVIHVQNENDPVIHQNKASIEKELREENLKHEKINNHAIGNNKTTIANDKDATDNKTSDHQINNIKTDNTGSDQNIVVEDPKVDIKTTADEKVIDQEAPSASMTFTSKGKTDPFTYIFNANAQHYNSIKWDFGDGKTLEGQSVSHNFESPGTYQVKMSVIGDTEVYDEMQEIVIEAKSSIAELPNVITPNGDRINDYFEIEAKEIAEFYIVISNQAGQVVFESSDVDFRWNGVDMSGNQLDVGTYRYMIVAEGKDGKVFKLPGAIHIQK